MSTATTLPMPTTMPTTMPTQLGNESCATPLEYSVVRKNNLNKITEYYNTLLNEYSKTYTDYASQSNSVNTNDRTYAETTLKPKTEAYNTQIINLSKELIDTVNKDTDLILDQKNELETKTQKIDTLMNDIKLLKQKNTDLSIIEKSQVDSLNTTKTGADDLKMTSQLYMGVNILLVLLVIGFIVYLVYSNFTTKSSNSNMNNIYKNIKSNTI
jgi:hypothetical protein